MSEHLLEWAKKHGMENHNPTDLKAAFDDAQSSMIPSIFVENKNEHIHDDIQRLTDWVYSIGNEAAFFRLSRILTERRHDKELLNLCSQTLGPKETLQNPELVELRAKLDKAGYKHA